MNALTRRTSALAVVLVSLFFFGREGWTAPEIPGEATKLPIAIVGATIHTEPARPQPQALASYVYLAQIYPTARRRSACASSRHA